MKNTFLIPSNSTLQDALQVINDNSKKIALVSNDAKTLLGVITDGDIRRALLKSSSLNTSIENFYNKNPITCKPGISKEAIQTIIREKQILHVIEVNDKMEILKIHSYSKLESGQKNYTAVIIAGGRGIRLMPLTENIPKPMIQINRKPILHTIIENLKRQGFAKIYISVYYKKEIIINYFKDGADFGLNIEYLIEEKPLGTGGPLSLLPEMENSFVVTNADIISSLNFASMLNEHNNSSAFCSMLGSFYKIQVPYGVISLDEEGNFKGLQEKPSYDFLINGGVYVLSPQVLKYIPKYIFFNITDLIQLLKQKNIKIHLISSKETWHDIGNTEDLRKFNFSI